MPAPFGNQNAAKAKRWEAAICRALSSWPNPPDNTDCSALIQGLNLAAHEFVRSLHAERDIAFFRELGDRLDGKPAQAITGEDGGAVKFEVIAPWMATSAAERNG